MELQMTATQQAVCALIRAALFEGSKALPEQTDLKEVFREMAEQCVLALPGDILKELDMPQALRQLWTDTIKRQAFSCYHLISEQSALVMLLDEAGIPFVVLKGTAAAMLYPRPEYRAMGDIDFLVPAKDFERTQKLLLENGFSPVGEITEQTRDCPYQRNGILFELHRHFAANLEDAQSRELEKSIQDGLARAQRQTILGSSFPMLPPLENGLVLLEHISQHLEAGLGLRQIIDWLMYVRSTLHDAQWPEFGAAAERVGLRHLALVVTRMGQLYFGLPEEGITWCCDADEGLCRELLAHLFDSGDFGHKDMGRSATVNAMSRSSDGFFRNLQASGCRNWKLLARCPYLKPFAWLYQLCRYVRLGLSRKSPIRGLIEDMARGRRLNRMLRELGATRHGKKPE